MEDQAAELNRQTEARLNEIETEIKNQPLTSDLRNISDLTPQYEAAANNFLAGIEDLEKNYSQIRIVRGDGNCYYRAFLYNLAEHIFQNKQEGERILECVKKDSWERVLKAGYDACPIITSAPVGRGRHGTSPGPTARSSICWASRLERTTDGVNVL
jgi:hypothetical protein